MEAPQTRGMSSDSGSFCSWTFKQLQTPCNFLLQAQVSVAPAKSETRSLELEPLVFPDVEDAARGSVTTASGAPILFLSSK